MPKTMPLLWLKAIAGPTLYRIYQRGGEPVSVSWATLWACTTWHRNLTLVWNVIWGLCGGVMFTFVNGIRVWKVAGQIIIQTFMFSQNLVQNTNNLQLLIKSIIRKSQTTSSCWLMGLGKFQTRRNLLSFVSSLLCTGLLVQIRSFFLHELPT